MPEIVPRRSAPELTIETLDEGRFTLSERSPRAFTMLVFYRGLHCPVCRTYLSELHARIEDFHERGTEVIAISGDSKERAQRARDDWGLDGLTIGHGLAEEAMHEWGLYVSGAIKDDEPERFNEPGLFLIAGDGTVFYVAINSMPFGRPSVADMLDAIDFVAENEYPARGEAAQTAAAAAG